MRVKRLSKHFCKRPKKAFGLREWYGVRVVRGPDWSKGDEDGGEGHVGTVTDDNEDNTVEVQWDMGNSGTYNTGKGGKHDLRVLDSSPVGQKHSGKKCNGCDANDFCGTLWACIGCSGVCLCNSCYCKDKHDITHPFKRVDIPSLSGTEVKKRSISNKLRALGIFSGAKVKRGVDWNSGDQDGGDGKIGTVTEVFNFASTAEKDGVKVTWPNKQNNSYRLGFRGKVDVQCVEEMPGMDYYRDHLFVLSTIDLQPPPIPARYKTADTAKSGSSSSSGGAKPSSTGDSRPPPPEKKSKLQVGDKVCVAIPESTLKELQRGHGGWSLRMADCIGRQGTVQKFEDNGDCVIKYDDREYRFNCGALRKVPNLSIGDTVCVIDNAERVQALQKKHGGWNPDMSEVLGKVGKVVKIDSDGDVAVAFGNKAWVFNPACCDPAPGQKVYEIAGTEPSGRSETSGGGRGQASGGPSGGKAGVADDDEVDKAAEAFAHLFAQLFLQPAQTAIGPHTLVQAAANNDAKSVLAILQKKPDLVDARFKGLTALIISSHEGHKQVVQILLAAKPDLNLREEKGNTALMAALMKKREEVGLLLIKAGADINLWNQMGRTAIHFAAANEANTVLRELLSRKANHNRQDLAGDTPLHDAILNKNNSGASFLVGDQTVNLTLANKKGHTPLTLAAMKDDEMTVERILARSPELKDVSKPDDGNTALHVAAVNDNTSVIKILIKKKANVNAATNQRYTPLHLACHQGHTDSVQLLIDAGASINAVDEDGDTPLHNCIMGRRSVGEQERLAQLLLGMRLNNQAEMKERTDLACYLIQNGASVQVTNKKGRTPLQCCSDDHMRSAIKSFADRHGGGRAGASGGAGGGKTATDALLELLMAAMPSPCPGCRQRQVDTTFLPCRHRVVCRNCAFRVRDCPKCSIPILERLDPDGNRLVAVDACKMQ
ncbi:hypothetical protein DPMN_161528 [Dreissena polymorpha]|uniref:RING-type E3 ubiquitin transferase n=1 Tax=Dreissena polymorpha TaxID=45954 RepID=A0A9D4EPT3_DREPO|nr:hypothetical protein DPMN_161528 [Dreissena polymorpha]